MSEADLVNVEDRASVERHVECVEHKGETLGIIVRDSYSKPGITFFTPHHLSQQLAYMQHEAGKVIDPHYHNPVPRTVSKTQETLFVKRGRLRVDFYDEEEAYLESHELTAGDVLLLIKGGHGFEVLEDLEMIEVKQGPYTGVADKTCFAPTNSSPRSSK